jgi:hypothetical protein
MYENSSQHFLKVCSESLQFQPVGYDYCGGQ